MKPSAPITTFILDHSGGWLQTERQVVVVASAILLCTIGFLLYSSSPARGGADAPPPYDAARDVPPPGAYDHD